MEQKIILQGKEYLFSCDGDDVKANYELCDDEGGIATYKVTFKWDKARIPQKIKLSYNIPSVDIHSMWDCGRKDRHLIWWNDHPFKARLASWMPVVEFVSKDGFNRYNLSIEDVKTPTATEFRVDYVKMEMEIIIAFFDGVVSPVDSYETLVRVDTRNIKFDDAIRSARKWYDELGYKLSYVPDAATLPMYSTWYSYFQRVTQQDVLNECILAKKLGMETVIVDDGWQTAEAKGNYNRVGDWEPYLGKFPDFRRLSDELHAIGMKIMVWFAMPFVGYDAKNYERFKGKYLCNNDGAMCSTLDPRYKEVRDFTVSVYERAVKDWNLDGLKLDFIDRFVSNGEVSPEMDFVSVEDATEQLLKDVTAKLKALNPDILIEFRQPYMGPVISTYGNMMRVWDCPDDPISNRISVLDLRLTSGKCAVHSDMIDWGKDDTPENVAVQLISTLFSVPQISVCLAKINDKQRAVLVNYLDFWKTHRKTIMEGSLSYKNPESLYSYAETTLGEEKIAVAYSTNVVDAQKYKAVFAFNLTAEKALIVKSYGGEVEVYDCTGALSYKKTLARGLNEVETPLAGMIKIVA